MWSFLEQEAALSVFMKSHSLAILKDYFSSTFKFKYLAVFLLFVVIADYVLSLITPIFYKNFFNILAAGELSEQATAGLMNILLIIAVAYFFRWLFIRLGTFISIHIRTKVVYDLSNRCFAYLHKHSFDYFNSEFVGSLVKRVQWYVRAFESIFEKFLWDILPLIIGIFGILLVVFFVHAYLAWIILIWLAVFMAFNIAVIKYKLKYDLQRSQAATKVTAVLADTITNQSNVKLFNGYDREVKNFSKVTDKLRSLQKLTGNISAGIDAVQSFLMFALEIGIFYFAIKFWQQGLITVGDFFLLQSYVITIFWRVWDFGRVIRDIYENLADAAEMHEILNKPHDIQDVSGAKSLLVSRAEIEFKNVKFAYPRGADIMENFNLKIGAGERLALIGPSGAGKTTVVKLLLRMYDPQGGQILIDDQDISQVTQESLWQNVSLVPQDPILFHQPLIENIRYGRPGVTDEEVIKAAKAAHCHEFISGLADGYDTYVGERGIKLSGGERQRVAIARAILRNAPILLLDEATSSLDSESEGFIQDALDELMKGKTVIVIAHRLSTIKKMNRIVVIDNGEVIEQGTHKDLNKLSQGVYRKLWELQAGGFV